MAIKVGINGFGRIGRAFFRLAHTTPDIAVVAINDLGPAESLAYLLKRDTVYGTFAPEVHAGADCVVVNGTKIPVFAEKDPGSIPWSAVGAEVVVESTGVFDSFEKAGAHLGAGARRVVITAPAKDADSNPNGSTVLMGINTDKLKTSTVTSNASCTTNAGSPIMTVLDETLGVECALLNTTHAYTASQALVDGPTRKNLRDGRAAAQNIVPSSTGAAHALAAVLPQFKGVFDGISVRVPVSCGSLVDVTFIAKRDTTAEEVNAILRKAAAEHRWEGILAASDEPLVSSDIVGDTHAAIADLAMTRVVGKRLVKVLAWYDNEMGYAHTLLMHVRYAGTQR